MSPKTGLKVIIGKEGIFLTRIIAVEAERIITNGKVVEQ